MKSKRIVQTLLYSCLFSFSHLALHESNIQNKKIRSLITKAPHETSSTHIVLKSVAQAEKKTTIFPIIIFQHFFFFLNQLYPSFNM